jgi:hypothetical protein
MVSGGNASQTKSNRFQDSKAAEEKTTDEKTNRIQPKTELVMLGHSPVVIDFSSFDPAHSY